MADGAIASYGEAIRHNPAYAEAHNDLGVALKKVGRVPEAITAFRNAIEQGPTLVRAHKNLANTLKERGDVAGAITALREWVRLDPQSAEAHWALGKHLIRFREDAHGAIPHLRTAVAREPTSARCNDLGVVLRDAGESADAVRQFLEAIRLDPTNANPHRNLGLIYFRSPDNRTKGIALLREAVRLAPKNGDLSRRLGAALQEVGDLAGAEAAFVEAIRVNSKDAASERFLQGVRTWIGYDRRLPELIAGRDRPKSPAEAVQIAYFAGQSFKREYQLAYRLFAEAMTADPKQWTPGNLSNAACMAVRVAAGDDPRARIGEEEWHILHAQARGWLTAALAPWRASASSEKASDRKSAREAMAFWQRDPDLKPARDPSWLGVMPADDRRAWERLWTDVADVARLAGPEPAPAPRPVAPR